MKIYILRHEDRTQDCTFFSPLTELGLHNSKKLVDVLKLYSNIHKAKKRISWIPRIKFLKGLTKTINFYKKTLLI